MEWIKYYAAFYLAFVLFVSSKQKDLTTRILNITINTGLTLPVVLHIWGALK